MLNQKRSGSLARLKVPAGNTLMRGDCFAQSTLAFSKTYGWVDIAPHHIVDIAPHRIKPANTSAQVVEPKKHLVLIKNGMTGITDTRSKGYKVRARLIFGNGSTRIYTAYNLSNKDRAKAS